MPDRAHATVKIDEDESEGMEDSDSGVLSDKDMGIHNEKKENDARLEEMQKLTEAKLAA